ncbi:hypothetical protein EIP86_001701 [Pleurotus ostreatoroseus]|nr:hypothetical protein EIP86_001701 [Pleurotus ostreatoroseus]
MSGSQILKLEEIVKQMGTEPNNSTLGWDVVVNYKESEINDLLEESYHNDPDSHVKELDLELTGYDQDANPYTISFHFELGPPRIKFVGEGIHPSCELYIPINGGQTKTSTQTLDIYAGAYELRLMSLLMATMSGSTGDLTEGSKPFIFPPQGSETASVTIDMRASSDSEFAVQMNNVSSDESIQNKQVNAHLGDLEKQTRAYFVEPENVTSIQYKLASVDSTPPPDGYIALHPKSFRFAAYRSETYPTTVLSLFIQTSETATGIQADLQQHWTGQWVHDYNVAPISETHSASIIFNSTMMHNTVISPAFKAADIEADAPSFLTGKGLVYKIRTNKTIDVEAYEEGLNHFDGVHVDLNDDEKTLRLTLGQNVRLYSQLSIRLQIHTDYYIIQDKPEDPAAGYVKWNYTYNFKYGTTRFVPNPAGGTTTVDDSGTCTVENSLSKESAFSSKLSDGTLDMDLAISERDWDKPKVTKTADSAFSTVFGNANPTWFDSTLPSMPSVNIHMGSLYFFLTTNLLMPGKKVISIDANAGLRIPHDFYIVGTIVH